jgi:hypothetical protein
MNLSLTVIAYLKAQVLRVMKAVFLRGRENVRSHTSIIYPAALTILLLSQMCLSQTSIVAFGDDTSIVIGADSKRIVTRKNVVTGVTSAETANVCKIHKSEGFFFACSGPCFDEISTLPILEESKQGRSILENIEASLPRVKAQLAEYLTSWRETERDIYISKYGTKKAVLQLLFVGFENKAPTIYALDLQNPTPLAEPLIITAGKISVCSTLAEPCGLAIGKDEAIRRFLSRPSGQAFLKKKPLVKVRQLVQVAIEGHPDEVGPPVDILRITKNGAQWINRKPECQEEKLKPKSRNSQRRAFSSQPYTNGAVPKF